jgi:signal transduction histidine kinase/DNA-binding response OmpR family regulator
VKEATPSHDATALGAGAGVSKDVSKGVPKDAPNDLDEKVNILVVDDLPDKLLVFETVLEELGQNLVFVKSGREALREVLQREFAVILLDVNMPEIDGFETAALLRKYKRSADTPIIFITSFADEIQTERGYAMGAVDYIQSPVVPHILRSKVRVFVRLYAMQRQVRRQADAHAAALAADAARRVAEANDRRSGFLANASRVLNGSLDVKVGLRALAGLVVPELASLAVVMPAVMPAGGDGQAGEASDAGEVVVIAGRSGAAERPVTALDAAIFATLVAAKQGRVRVDMPAEQLARLGALEGHDTSVPNVPNPPPNPLDADWCAVAALPLLSGDRLHGVLLVAANRSRQQADWSLLGDLAARAATALENARLYESLQLEIVERRAAEAELQEASRRKDEFLAMLSHELRNPLAPIRTALEVTRRIAPPDPKFAWASDIMDRQLRQLTRLVEELLDVARISQGKIVLKREKVDLNAVIAHSVETAQPNLEARGQTLHVRPFSEALWLHGDFARLAQVVSNLLHNASKYSEQGAEIELDTSVESNGAVIRVRDQGIGIEPQLLPQVFDLFTQGARGLDRTQGGLGVGLTLARRLAQMHGGSIEAFSAGGGAGSEFVVRLPCLGLVVGGEAAPAAVVGSAAPARQPIRCRILIVDDNHDAALSLATYFEMGGHEVRTAGDGRQALEVAAGFTPQAVVLDIGLPILNGYQVAQQLRLAPAMQQALLLALTGYGQKEDQLAAAQAGFDRHFVKPVDPAALASCIETWLNQNTSDAAAQKRPGMGAHP